MTQQEKNAREYCVVLGKCPDERVYGYSEFAFGRGVRGSMPRWNWYVGASVETARSAHKLSPGQRALGYTD